MIGRLWSMYDTYPEDAETPYEIASGKERAAWIAEFMEWKTEAQVGPEKELTALINLYVDNGVRIFIDLDWPDKIVLTAAYIAAFPKEHSQDLLTDLGDVDLLTEISKTMENIAMEQMFSQPNEKTAVKFMHLITAAFMNACAENLQEDFDEIIKKNERQFGE
tara:strand:- start:561 stop:1049 length:489 start_codon:yes stop_codon:yes gene_type:complete